MQDNVQSVFTLLADDYTTIRGQTAPVAIDEAQYSFFRSHLIHQLILNDRVMLSDSQVMTGQNLRRLMRRDSAFRAMVKEGLIGVAIRATPEQPSKPLELSALARQFEDASKISPDNPFYRQYDELVELDEHAIKSVWRPKEIAQNYVEGAKNCILTHLSPQLSAADRRILEDLIAEEEDHRGGISGLDRYFYQITLRDRLYARLEDFSRPYPEFTKLFFDLAVAPYVSNLPSSLGYDPIYTEDLTTAFQLYRGMIYRTEAIGDPIEATPPLSYDHFVEGLNRLDLDDVMTLREHSKTREYKQKALYSGPQSEDDHRDIQQLFEEVTVLIEQHIIARFTELKDTQRVNALRRTDRTIAVAEKGGQVFGDILGITSGVPIVGTVISIGCDILRGRTKTDSASMNETNIAEYNLKRRQIEQMLKAAGKADKVSGDIIIQDTSSFKTETMVA